MTLVLVCVQKLMKNSNAWGSPKQLLLLKKNVPDVAMTIYFSQFISIGDPFEYVIRLVLAMSWNFLVARILYDKFIEK